MKEIERLHRQYWKKVKEALEEVNVVVEVLDSRFPFETRNKQFEKMVQRKGKVLIRVLSKADLVPKDFLNRNARKLDAIPISVRKRMGKVQLIKRIKRSVPGEIRVLIVGYPNVGKSSLINYLKGKKSAKVSPRPGYTKGVQWIRVGNVMFYDTPGVLPPQTYKRMILLGAVDPSYFKDPIPAAAVVIKKIAEVNPKALEKYGKYNGDVDKFLEKVAEKYNYKLKGNKLDLNRAARKILDDWIKGKIKVYW